VSLRSLALKRSRLKLGMPRDTGLLGKNSAVCNTEHGQIQYAFVQNTDDAHFHIADDVSRDGA